MALARAFAHRPPILLADEPTGNLDAASGAAVLDLLAELRRESRSTLLIVTHDERVAALADRVVRMTAGRLTTVPAA